MGEMIRMEPGGMTPLAMAEQLQQMTEAMQAMATMLRATHEEMAALRRQVQLLEKLTPAQASALNAWIRVRAAELCAEYRLTGREKAVAALIRKAIKAQFGASTVRELPRCDYEAARMQVELWDDTKALRAMKGRERSV